MSYTAMDPVALAALFQAQGGIAAAKIQAGGRNIEKVKKLIAGVGGQGTPRIGYTGKTIHMRKEGEIWEEPSGRK